MKSETNHKGRLNICRMSNGTEHRMRIEVIDTCSRVHFLRAELSMEEFAMALTAMGDIPCEFVLVHPELVGSIAENKEERVPYPRGYVERDSVAEKRQIAAALKPFEIDGWSGREEDLRNGHRTNRDGTQTVTFFRHVHAKTKQPIPC